MDKDRRFRIIKKTHGKGGFAKIAKAEDTELERLVAIKTLLLLDDEDSRERFKREAIALAQMSHSNIPSIYDVIFGDDIMQIIFEFVEGNTLRTIIADESIPSINEAITWFCQIASALDHAHSHNIIHRDIKPGNIIISENRSMASLVDFGIALTPDDVSRITKKGYVIGTEVYMSPEQRKGMDLTPASDIYSLGITLYETLAGKIPLPGEKMQLSEENEEIPPAIDILISLCMLEDSSLRLSSCKDFITKLKTVIMTDRPLSELIAGGRLHEIHAVLSKMTPDEFNAKPKGQKLAIIMRIKGLLRIEKRELVRPTIDMLSVIIRLAVNEEEHYEEIVRAGFKWGFEREYGLDWKGDKNIRESIIIAADEKKDIVHETIAKIFIEFVDEDKMGEYPGWYNHDLRVIVMHLLANRCCEKYADDLAHLYDKMNE